MGAKAEPTTGTHIATQPLSVAHQEETARYLEAMARNTFGVILYFGDASDFLEQFQDVYYQNFKR